ncbi:uncharacterized protein LOC134260234 [Saccostrea cucullata]|uniref:uncharacterized protein LOC134260234 n=1 Tax=Saccostrea cuccullata TaxID=36930 RepID=UPI002ED1F7B1
MVNYHCIAVGCNNDSRKSSRLSKYPHMVDQNGNVVNFYVLPSATKNPKLRRQWINAVRRKNFKPSNTDHWHAVCSRHFVDVRPTDTNPIPTLFEYNNYMHDQVQGQGKRKTLTSKYNSTSSSQGNESHSEGKKQRTSQTSVFVQPVPVAELYQGIQHEIIIPAKEGGKVPITTDTPYSLPGIMQHDHPYVVSPVSGSSHLSDTDWADAYTQITNLEHENRHLKVHCEQLEERIVAFKEENTLLKNQLNESERQRKEVESKLLQRGAQLNMPPFCRPCQYGKGKYLTSKQIKESKNIASLRIHVERAIQRLESYKFFDDLLIKSLYEGQIFFIIVP